MRKVSILLSRSVVLLALMLLASCGNVKSDAKKAASFTRKSIEKTNEIKLEEAEKYFNKSQEIINKYESHKKSEKFFELYRQYRDEGKNVAHPDAHP